MLPLDLDAVLHQLQVGVHEAHAGVVGLRAGVALLGVGLGAVGDLLVHLVRFVHLHSRAGQLDVDLVDIESVVGVVEAELLEDALQVAVGHRVIGVLPLLVLLHELLAGVNLLHALRAIVGQILVRLHHIVVVMVMVIGEDKGQTQ